MSRCLCFESPIRRSRCLTSVVGWSSRWERDVAASIFPCRQGAQPTHQHLQRTGTVQTWTRSAAGALEFSLRAPLLGGISTVLLNLDDGPSVLLTVDDEDAVLEMDARMELVVRRLYAQEGFIRYGETRTIHD